MGLRWRARHYCDREGALALVGLTERSVRSSWAAGLALSSQRRRESRHT